MKPPASPRPITRSGDIGRLIAEGRRGVGLSQEQFATRLGVSRKTVSDLERGAAENVSVNTVLRAVALAGLVLHVSQRRPPTISEVLARRAAHQARVDDLEASTGTSREGQPPPIRRKGR